MAKMCGCGKPIPLGMVIDGKQRNFQNRIRCLDCMPFGQSKYKKKTEGERKAKNVEKVKRYYDKYKSIHGIDPINVLRNKRREQIIETIGGKCQLCGYDKLRTNLAFHHLRDKSFPLDARRFQYKIEVILSEVRKCVLICHNCHGEVHSGLVNHDKIELAHSILLNRIEGINFITMAQLMKPLTT